jgi:hypothetical protein
VKAHTAEAPVTPDRPGRGTSRWRIAIKVCAFVVFLFLASVAARGRPANGFYYRSAGEVASSLVVGLLVSVVVLAIVGSVGHLLRGRGRSWWTSATTFPVMLVTLLLLLGSAAGNASTHQDAVQAATPNPSGTQVEREKANLDAQAWAKSRTPLLRTYKSTLALNARFLRLFKADGNTASVRRLTAQIEQSFTSDKVRWQALPPTPLSDVAPIDAAMIRAVGLAANAFADYGAALRSNAAAGTELSKDAADVKQLDKGDSELNRSVALVQSSAKQLATVDHRYRLP